VVGIYAYYGNPKGQVAVNFAARPGVSPACRKHDWACASYLGDSGLISALRSKFGLDDRNVVIRPT